MILIERSHPNARERISTLLGAGLKHQPNVCNGDIYFVNSSKTGASNKVDGKNPDRPWSTIAYAVTKATANSLIVVGEGHTETVNSANEWDFANTGVWIQGQGHGAARPTIAIATDPAAQVLLDKASSVLQNLLFINSIDDLLMGIKVDAADCKLYDIEYREDSGDEAIDWLGLTANADRCHIDGIKIIGDVGGNSGDSAINVVGGDDVRIENFWIYGDYTQGAIENVTTAAVRLHIERGFIWTEAAEDLAIACVATSTGSIVGPIQIRLQNDTNNITECLVGGDMQFYGRLEIVNADGEQFLQWNGTPSADSV